MSGEAFWREFHDLEVVDRRFRSLPAHQKPASWKLDKAKKATEVGGDGWREGGLIQGRGTSSRGALPPFIINIMP